MIVLRDSGELNPWSGRIVGIVANGFSHHQSLACALHRILLWVAHLVSHGRQACAPRGVRGILPACSGKPAGTRCSAGTLDELPPGGRDPTGWGASAASVGTSVNIDLICVLNLDSYILQAACLIDQAL